MEIAEQIQDVITRLANIPKRIEQAVAGWDRGALDAAPGGEWSAAQILAHVRASDDILAYRIYAILVRDDPPFLAVYDERRWAEVAGYNQMEFQPALQRFAQKRADLIDMLRRITPDDWLRTGTREQLGIISVLDAAGRLLEHEEEHCVQLEAVQH